jgi:prophage regulatory protein
MKVIRLKEVMQITSLAKSTIYQYISDGKFVKPISLGGRSSGFLESEVQDWIASKISARDASLDVRKA